MNQIGPIFREARIKAGKEIDDASRETKIAKKYLIAIENEDFDVFPGETYLIGFIRNYAQFLGLDPDEMVIKYKDYKIQEQPVPIEQLMAKPRKNRKAVFIIGLLVFVIGIGAYIITKSGTFEGSKKKGQEKKEVKREAVTVKKVEEKIIVFDEEELIRDFVPGDVILIPFKGEEYRIKITGITDQLSLLIGELPFNVATDENVKIDFNRDGVRDVLIVTNVLGEGKVNLTLKKISEKSSLVAGLPGEKETPTSDKTVNGGPEVMIYKESEIAASLPILPEGVFQILSSYEKTDIKFSAKADDTAYLSYIPDDGEKVEKLLNPGDAVDVKAVDVLKITAANAAVINVEVNDVKVHLGGKGEVVAKVIRWYRDRAENELYHLVMEDWER